MKGSQMKYQKDLKIDLQKIKTYGLSKKGREKQYKLLLLE